MTVKNLFTCLICYFNKLKEQMAPGGAICTECASIGEED